jgi:hypothetical protein
MTQGIDSRTLGKKLRLPAVLLVLAAAGLSANLQQTPEIEASSQPAPVVTLASLPAPEVTTAAATAVPAVTTTIVVPAPAPFVFSRAQGLSPKVLSQALDAVSSARARGISGRDDLLTVIDYSLPSTTPRLWVLDLAKGKVLYRELVAHGAGSGDNYATHFSNVMDSRQTSLGLFLTGGTYEGGNGYSLRLKGLEEGLNDRAEVRNIVMHGAWYVSAEHARQHGRIGRSWGCPALPQEDAGPVIDTIKNGSFIYSYSDASPRQPAQTLSQVRTVSTR